MILYREQMQPQLPPGMTEEQYQALTDMLNMGFVEPVRGGRSGQPAAFRVRDHVIDKFF
jgi:hypothetical protein